MENTNQATAQKLFETIKAYRPGLKTLEINQDGLMTATTKTEKCCRQVAMDLALSGSVEVLGAKWDIDVGFFVITGKPKHLAN